MTRNLLLLLTFALTLIRVSGQDNEAYLIANAIRFKNAEKLNDSIYNLLSPFQIVMVGEMHGTNESAQFIIGLANLFTNKGDSVQVGLEINPEFMSTYLQLHTDSSVYQSEFFSHPPYLDGRESLPWANLIATLNKNPKVKIFFFDTNRNTDVVPFRDSLMAMNIKIQFNQHPTWKMITLSGNYHNKISDPNTMISFFKRNVPVKVCSLNVEYKEGSANANFTHGLEIRQLGSYPSVYNSTEGYDRYLLLYPGKSNYDYNGIYYTKYITAAKMTSSK
jgi:hypothetical protein